MDQESTKNTNKSKPCKNNYKFDINNFYNDIYKKIIKEDNIVIIII